METFEFSAYRFRLQENELLLEWNDDALHEWFVLRDVLSQDSCVCKGIRALLTALSTRDQRIAELERERDMYQDACQKYYDKQVAHNHKMENLPRIEGQPKDIREGLLLLADWFDVLYDEKGKDVDVQRDLRKWAEDVPALEATLAATQAERDKAVESIHQCRVFLRGCMNHAYDETPIVEVAKDVSEEFHRNRYQIQCMAKERNNIAKERDAANILLRRLMCVVIPDNAVPNDMKEFVRDSASTVLKDLWDYLKTEVDLRKAEHDAR